MSVTKQHEERTGVKVAKSLARYLARLYKTLIEPTATTEDNRRREYILNVVLTGSILMLVLLDSVVLYYTITLGANDHGVPFVAFSALPILFIGLLILSRKGHFLTSSYILIGMYLASESYAVIRWSADMPPALLGYAITIMLASILIGTTTGLVIVVIIGLFLVPTDYLQLAHKIPFDATWKQNPNPTDAIVFVALLAFITVIAWLSNREIEKSLIRARRSERALQEERDLLEVRVEERTQALKKAQFENIEQINRFAKFGQLASGLFHDLLNIMNTLSLKIEMGSETQKTLSDGTRMASKEKTSATTKQIEQFMQAIGKQLNSEAVKETFSLNESIGQVTQLLLDKAHRDKVHVAFDREGTPEIVYFGNPFEFHQIIFNLILNGIESYESLPVSENNKRIVSIILKRESGAIVVQVKDEGCGIENAILEKIFTPFFSTKKNTKGMGIGLASVKKLVEENLMGTIVATSNKNDGTVFTVSFPQKP